jgi:hypothetical protein
LSFDVLLLVAQRFDHIPFCSVEGDSSGVEVCTGPSLALGPGLGLGAQIMLGFGPGSNDSNQTGKKNISWAFIFSQRKSYSKLRSSYARDTH